MESWKSHIASIREIVTGTPSETWRSDLISIGQSFGHKPQSWREAIHLWGNSLGVVSDSWRNALSGIAEALGSPTPLSWREAVRFIYVYYQNSPPQYLQLTDSIGRSIYDNMMRALLIRG